MEREDATAAETGNERRFCNFYSYTGLFSVYSTTSTGRVDYALVCSGSVLLVYKTAAETSVEGSRMPQPRREGRSDWLIGPLRERYNSATKALWRRQVGVKLGAGHWALKTVQLSSLPLAPETRTTECASRSSCLRRQRTQ
jgi:hypothetical protein